eukprot:scaffold1142_cov83-Amphora_coffeaeformis.AAC.1
MKSRLQSEPCNTKDGNRQEMIKGGGGGGGGGGGDRDRIGDRFQVDRSVAVDGRWCVTSSETFNVLIDSGCSVSCTGFKVDFHGELAMGNFGYVNTANGQAKLDGFGMVKWDVVSLDGNRRTIKIPAFFSSAVPLRLLSPQDYCRYHSFDSSNHNYRGTSSWMSIDVKCSDDENDFSIETVLAHIAPDLHLPFLCAERGHHEVNESKETRCHCHVTSVYDVQNTNLSAAQKRLKLDHDRLGHLSMQLIQKLYQPEDQSMPDFDGHPTSGLPCLLAPRKRPTGATTKTPVLETVNSIGADDLEPGETVSVNQYESSVRSRRLETKGLKREDHKYCGGTLFYDHASGRIFFHHQTSLSSHESILAKDAFEREAALCGFSIKKYRTDNGIFTSKDYRQALAEGQSATRSAVGAHHQNGIAETNIGRVQRMARAMLLHLRLHWPDEFSPDLWPFALDYAVYIYNHVPRKGKAGAPLPIEFFCGAKVGCRPLRRLREHWIDLFLNSRESYLDVHDESVDGPIPELDMEYQPPDPREYSNQGEPQEHVGQGEPSQAIESPTLTQQPQQPQAQQRPAHNQAVDDAPIPDDSFDDYNDPQEVVPTTSRPFDSSSGQTQPSRSGSRVIEVEVSPSVTEQEEHNPEGVPQSPFRPRRSTRPRNQWNEPPLTYESLGGHALLLKQVRSRLFDYVVLSTSPDVLAFATLDWETVMNEPLYAHFHELFARQINPDTLELFDAQDAFHPFAFSAKLQSKDFPTYSNILRMEPIERAKWLQAMDQEINDLLDRNTFKLVPRSEPNSKNEQVIKSMWAFYHESGS